MRLFFLLSLGMLLNSAISLNAHAQQRPLPASADSLKAAILQLETELDATRYNLDKTGKRLQNGILISAIGYSVVILGGVLGGADNENLSQLGQPLIFSGGVIGFSGAVVLFSATRSLRKAGKAPPVP
jgi:hypothetical protein